jgi:hypothetical protein
MRKFAGMSAAAALGLVLGGCVAFDGKIEGEQISANMVKIEFTLCSDAGNSTCQDQQEPEPTREEAERGDDFEERVLIGFRALQGTAFPDKFSPKGVDLNFTPNSSYTRELNQKVDSRRAQRWFGYVSEPIGDIERRGRFAVKAALAPDEDSTFGYRPVVGFIESQAGTYDKVDCGEDPQAFQSDETGSVQCIDDPGENRRIIRNLKVELDG